MPTVKEEARSHSILKMVNEKLEENDPMGWFSGSINTGCKVVGRLKGIPGSQDYLTDGYVYSSTKGTIYLSFEATTYYSDVKRLTALHLLLS